MTVRKAFLIIFASAAVFSVIGTAVGLLLAKLAPGFYLAAFNFNGAPQIDAFELGFGFGLTVGGLVGIGVGVAVVLAVAWYEARQNGHGPGAALAPQEAGTRSVRTNIFRP